MLNGEAVTAPAEAVAEAKAYLRIFGNDEDALVARLAGTGIGLCEQYTGQAALARAFGETLPASAAWRRLAMRPVRAITAVEALAADGSASPLAANAYAIDIDANGEGWVRVTAPGEAKRVRVSYEAGIAATWASIPDALRQGMLRLVAHCYTHRDRADEPPAAVSALWRPWRRIRIG